MADSKKNEKYTLKIPLDASGVDDFSPEQTVKVALVQRRDVLEVQRVKFNKQGRGAATFNFDGPPGSLRIVVGPESAEDNELVGLQTINREMPARVWQERREITLEPILISAYYWRWWLRWCRTFVIRGRVVCPDGSPVPGAEVCAFDVDHWWWWGSRQQVGCATTGASGSFEITFRWCCGWLPWWWWRQRHWYLEPALAERIIPLLREIPELQRPPVTGPRPDPVIFDEILGREQLLPLSSTAEIRPERLDQTRQALLEHLPQPLELQRLRLWPWWPWRPWWDCTPDIIFQVRQTCEGQEKVIVDESWSDTRWDIPESLSVTLVANDEACCIPQCGDDCPEGNCLLITHACGDPIYTIGGNPGAAATPAGYRSPGVIATGGDRPYGGVIPIRGLFGDLANVDYYEFEWSDDGGTIWNAMPPAAAGGFHRVYWGPRVGTTDPPEFHAVPFGFTTIDGRNVVESREHFEANNDPLSWGITRFWVTNRDLLFRWRTENNFPDGTYQLRVAAWNQSSSGLTGPTILPLCDTSDDNGITLTVDNRVVGAASGHPTTPDHPCGAGTVHTCTTEPDTDIISVRLVRGGVALDPIGACGETILQNGDVLRVDFLAHDPDGHLANYSLNAHYGENAYVNLLALGGTLSPLAGAIVPPAAQEGPNYGNARNQGAAAPTWAGGALRLEVDARSAFPKTCCYLLRLLARKRTIVSCNDNYPHRNQSEYSFMVTV